MLKRLYLKNYGLFEETEIYFPSGFTIITGETGAGKSLLVGALGMIQGKRMEGNVIFLADEKCVVEAEFEKLSNEIIQGLLEFEYFDVEDNTVIIRREISTGGKSRAFINDTPVSLTTLRDACTLLIDLHGQHENQSLLSAEQQMGLLDAFAESEGEVLLFKDRLRDFRQIQQEILSLETRESEMRKQYDYLQHLLKEFSDMNPKADEEEQLEAEIRLLQNSETLRESLGMSVEKLYQDERSIYTQLSELVSALEKISGVSPQLRLEYERLSEIRANLKEISYNLSDLLDSAESNPERLSLVEDRLAQYYRLKLKHGVKTGAELVATYEGLQSQLTDFNSLSDKIQELKIKLASHTDLLSGLALRIERKRFAAKADLEERVDTLLAEVGFTKARFSVQIERSTHPEGELEVEGQKLKPNAAGINKVSFLIQPNPGIPAGPLAQIASGGEISRVMLAIKAALAEKSRFPVMIFDEIDTGISGEIANKVGAVMYKLARKFQLISITHLPQIAAKGDQHFKILKRVTDTRTTSTVRPLGMEDRVTELAVMLSGDSPTESALSNARELIGKM